jgi:hypothetical protein
MNRHEFLFKPGYRITTGKKNSQILEVEYLDYTRNVYIFKEPWVHNLSQFTSYDALYIEEKFHLITF